MMCPRCKVEMVEGYAIRDNGNDDFPIMPRPAWTWGNLPLMMCLKCPICGHSDDKSEQN